MNIETLREYCISKPAVHESFPFDEVTLVFKVMGKMFAMTNLDGELTVNLKCDPELAIELREKYNFVLPGYHMSKVHWNTILIYEGVPDALLNEWIDHSYNLVVSKLPKRVQQQINQ
jgi:predicted DNA-binding protein (MmcQ/YjbR family)